MPQFAAATDKSEFSLVEPGKYIATCVAIEDAPDKGFGPGVKWVFTLVDATNNQPVRNDNGFPLEFWQFTSTKMGPKSRCRPIIEALLGRPLENGEVPDSNKMLNKALVGMIIHEKNDAGEDRARLASCKPWASQATATPAPVAPAQPGFDADGNEDNSALINQIRSQIKKAEILQTPRHLDWIAAADTLAKASRAELEAFQAEVLKDIAA